METSSSGVNPHTFQFIDFYYYREKKKGSDLMMTSSFESVFKFLAKSRTN